MTTPPQWSCGTFTHWQSNRDAIYFDRTTTWSGPALLQVGAKMKKFMAIYMASGADFERMIKRSTPEQRSKGMEAWMNDNKASILESGAPLGKTKRADAVAIQFLGRCS